MRADRDPSRRGQRRSKLITPGDNWEFISKSTQSGADIVHLDLEDGVSPQNKPAARVLVARALEEIDWGDQEVWVRINHFDSGYAEADVEAVIAGRPNLIFMAKTQGPEDMRKLDALVAAGEARHDITPGSIQIGAVIERVRALACVEEIAAATPRMGMLAFGVGDLSNEYRYRHSQIPGGDYETLYARSRMVLAARLAGIDVIDAPFAGFRDQESGRKDADFSARLGFDGKSAISPRQIPGIHAAFDPSPKEISWAEEVMEAKREADRSGTAIFTVDGTMIDKPHFIMAERILARIGDQ